MDVDDAFEVIGYFGPGQRKMLLPLLIGGNICISWIMCLGIFTQYEHPSTSSEENKITSIVNDFGTTPEQNKLITAAVMLGVLVGGAVFGKLADKFGRQKIAMIMLPACILVTASSILCMNWQVYAISRFFQGLANGGLLVSVAVLGFECTGKTYWGPLTVAASSSFAIGVTLLAIIAKYLTNWRVLTLAVSLPNLYLVLLFRAMPESPRWLYSVGKIEEAEKILKILGKKNGKPLTELNKVRLKRQNSVTEDQSVCSVFSQKFLFIRLITKMWIWFANSLVYYGLTLGSDSLGSDIYENTVFSGLCEIPGYLLCWMTIDHRFFGRKRTVTLFMITSGLGMAAIDFLDLTDRPKQILGLLSKMLISGAFSTIYVYTCELFPTGVRSMTIGGCSLAARLGGIAVPFAVSIGQRIRPDDHNPEFLLYAICATSAGFLCTFLHETLVKTDAGGNYTKLASFEDLDEDSESVEIYSADTVQFQNESL